MKAALVFLAKFAGAVTLCFYLWWGGYPEAFGGLMAPYVWAAGQAAGALLVGVFGAPIAALDIVTEGVMNSRSSLTFALSDGRSETLPIEPLVMNLPSYIALVVSTAGLGWRRMAIIAAAGSLILMATHVLYIVIVFQFGAVLVQWRQIPEMLITLPFLLWIVLAYWRHVRPFFAGAATDDSSADEASS